MNKNEIAALAAALSDAALDAKLVESFVNLSVFRGMPGKAEAKLARGILAEAAKRGVTWTITEGKRINQPAVTIEVTRTDAKVEAVTLQGTEARVALWLAGKKDGSY